MRMIVAFGGNALARRGEPMTAAVLRENARAACRSLAPLAAENDLVLTHGNGPQVGLLALQNLAYAEVPAYPLDLLGAETQGMIGHVLAQEMENALHGSKPIASLLTDTEVAADDDAFAHPAKFIGPAYAEDAIAPLARQYSWTIARDGSHFRRVVPSPQPIRVLQAGTVRLLLERGHVVICTGGGGVPVTVGAQGTVSGIEAVIDKDLASAVLAEQIGADALYMLTDADFVVQGWGTPQQRNILCASADAISRLPFAEGSMKPKVDAAVRVVRAGGRAFIGPITRIEDITARRIGTEIRAEVPGGIEYC